MGDMIRCSKCRTHHYRNDPCPDFPKEPEIELTEIERKELGLTTARRTKLRIQYKEIGGSCDTETKSLESFVEDRFPRKGIEEQMRVIGMIARTLLVKSAETGMISANELVEAMDCDWFAEDPQFIEDKEKSDA